MSPRSLFLSSALALVLIPESRAAIIFQSDFNTDPEPAPSFSFLAGTGTTINYNTNGPGGSRALELADNGTGSAVATLDFGLAAFPTFNTATSGQELIRMTADFAVTTMVGASNSASIPRILFRNTANTANGLTLGLGQTSAGNLILYAAKGDNATPSAGNRVVLINYGAYDATTGNEHLNDTNDVYVRIAIEYFNGSDTLTVSAYNGSTLLTSGNLTGFTGVSFSNSNLDVLFATGTGGVGTAYLDNVLIEAVPEPSAIGLAVLGALGFIRRKR